MTMEHPPKANRRMQGGGLAKPNKELGRRLQELRVSVGLTQQELADATGVTREYIAHIEAGRVKGVIYPDLFNKLRRQLGFAGWEMLESMGYQTGATPSGSSGVNAALLARLSMMTPAQQRTVLSMIMLNDRLGDDGGSSDTSDKAR